MGKNVEIKPVLARIHIADYIESGHELKVDDIIDIGDNRQWTILELYYKYNSIIIVSDKLIDVCKIKNEADDFMEIYVIKDCILKSEVAGIGIQQLNIFKDV